MSTLNPPKKISRRQELREDTLTTVYARGWDLYDRHKQVVWAAAGGLVVLALLGVAYLFYMSSQEAEAQALLGASVRTYEAGDYRAALEGNDTALGLRAIAEDYSGTDAGNLALFYAGDALFRLGEYDEALAFFEDFDAGANYIGASAFAGRAAIYEQRGDFEQAGDYYLRAAHQFENEVTSPQYLLQAGRAYEAAGAYGDAASAYQEILDDYADAPAATNVSIDLARVNALQQAR